MKRLFWLALCLAMASAPALANGFSNWAVLIVAGDNHAHDGSHADVFDNARRDLAKELAGIGFSPANMLEFSVDPAPDAQSTDIARIASGLWDLSNRAPGGCLIYFTSHGSPDGILTGDKILAPDKMAAVVNNSCGSKPSVIVMSSCFSGIFVPALAAPSRMVMSAARPDRTSFGCGNDLKYTFFDQCFLQALPQVGNFPDAADKAVHCVAQREQKEGMTPPSEPQLAVGKNVVYTLNWR